MRSNIKIGVLFLLFGSVFLAGCYYDNEEELYEFYYANTNCDTIDVSWADDIQPIIDGNCAVSGCHIGGGSGNGIFENYEGVKVKADNGSMLQRTVVTRDMPPSGPLSSCQIELISSWIDAGAPNN